MLLSGIEPDKGWINSRCYFRDEEGVRVVFLGYIPIYQYMIEDNLMEKFVVVRLIQDGYAKQKEVSETFGYVISRIRRWQRNYEKHGIDGLGRKKRESVLLKMGGAMDDAVHRMFHKGITNGEMGRRIGVSEFAIRNTLKRLGLKRKVDQGKLLKIWDLNDEKETAVEAKAVDNVEINGNVNELVEEEIETNDKESGEIVEVDAGAGKEDDIVPVFAAEEGVSLAGVLLAVPMIIESGIVEVFEKFYKGIFVNAYYGIRTMVMLLMIMSLIRIKRPENLKGYSPEDLGHILGLERVPEVKTVRRNIGKMAEKKIGAEVMRELARRRLHDEKDIIGFLYVDGHVREYHGKGKLSKTHITQRRSANKATTDTWVNDAKGDPVFVVTSELNAGLTKMLETILDDVEKIVGKGQKMTMVFDRLLRNAKIILTPIQHILF